VGILPADHQAVAAAGRGSGRNERASSLWPKVLVTLLAAD
jgi:hypothetical protein